MKLYVTIFFLLLSFITTPLISVAQPSKVGEELPLWEVGLAPVMARLPHYRGSDEYENYIFPLPYFIYRGDIIKAERGGVRGIFWRNEKFETDISFSGNPPVSGDNKARQGMDDLDALIEVGPAIRYFFHEHGERDSFFLQASVRFATSVDFDDGFDSGYEGIVSDLNLIYRDSRTFRDHNIRFHLSTGIQFGDSDIHSYFYDVDPQFATVDRPAYESEGGYAGLQVSGSLMKELTPSLSIGGYFRYINTEGAAFDDSPLFKETHNYIAGILVLWKLAESKKVAKK